MRLCVDLFACDKDFSILFFLTVVSQVKKFRRGLGLKLSYTNTTKTWHSGTCLYPSTREMEAG